MLVVIRLWLEQVVPSPLLEWWECLTLQTNGLLWLLSLQTVHIPIPTDIDCAKPCTHYLCLSTFHSKTAGCEIPNPFLPLPCLISPEATSILWANDCEISSAVSCLPNTCFPPFGVECHTLCTGVCGLHYQHWAQNKWVDNIIVLG